VKSRDFVNGSVSGHGEHCVSRQREQFAVTVGFRGGYQLCAPGRALGNC